MSRKLIVISMDAMVAEDVAKLKTMPNTHRFLSHAAEVRTLRTVYPTITYPVHASISTGCYPDRTGVFSNDVVRPGHIANGKWNWFHDIVQVLDIYTAAKKKGLTIGNVFWPVTAGHPDIDYNIPEYWSQKDIRGDDLHKAMKRAGVSRDMLKIIDKYEPLIHSHERQHPQADDFVFACAAEIVRTKKPDLMMIHPAHIDGYRHHYGLWNDRVDRGIMEADQYIGQIIHATRLAGTYEDTNFVILSDHGQINIDRIISINAVLVDKGLIRTRKSMEGKTVADSWDVWVMSGGTTAWVFVKDPAKEAEVYRVLNELMEAGVYGIGRIFTRAEAEKQERLSGPFSFVLETDGYTAFSEKLDKPYATSFDHTDYRYGRATHGHLPDLGPQPIFLAKGPSFREDVVLERRPIVDTTATFARILGLEMPRIDGKVMEELLWQQRV